MRQEEEREKMLSKEVEQKEDVADEMIEMQPKIQQVQDSSQIIVKQYRSIESETVIRMGSQPYQIVINYEEAVNQGLIEQQRQIELNVQEEINAVDQIPQIEETLLMRIQRNCRQLIDVNSPINVIYRNWTQCIAIGAVTTTVCLSVFNIYLAYLLIKWSFSK